jgi:hypothetical protein
MRQPFTLGSCLLCFVVAACGGAKAPVGNPTTTSSPAASASASVAPATPATPPAHPVAKTSAEATSLIDDAITARQKEIGQCVASARTRRNNAHAEVVLEIGIDQEGTLIGVKSPKGAPPDPALQECVMTALKNAPFPRSKAGVISVRKTFSDEVVYP